MTGQKEVFEVTSPSGAKVYITSANISYVSPADVVRGLTPPTPPVGAKAFIAFTTEVWVFCRETVEQVHELRFGL